MALNEMIAQGAQFNMPDPVAQYNKLAQMQQYQSQNELNRQEALDKATERQRIVSERTKRSTFLTQFGAKLAEKGVALNKETVAGMISSGVPEIEKLGFEALKALQSDESYNIAMGGGGGAANAPAPAPAPTTMAAAAPIPTSGVSPSNIGAETFISTGVGATNFNRTATSFNPTTGEFEPVPDRDQAAAGLFDKINKTYSPAFGTLALTKPQILTRLNNKLAALTDNPPEGMTPQIRAEMIAATKEEIIATAAGKRDMITPTNEMAPQAPAAAAVANAMAPAPASAVAPPQTRLQSLVDQYERFSRIPNPDKRVENRIKFLTEEIVRLSKKNLHTVQGVGLVDADTREIVYAQLPLPTETTRLLEERADLIKAGVPTTDLRIQALDQKLAVNESQSMKMQRELQNAIANKAPPAVITQLQRDIRNLHPGLAMQNVTGVDQQGNQIVTRFAGAGGGPQGQFKLDQAPTSTARAMLGLNEADSSLLFGPGGAVEKGLIPVSRLTPSNVKMYVAAVKANPNLNFTDLNEDQVSGLAQARAQGTTKGRQALTLADRSTAQNIANGNIPPLTGPNSSKIMNEVISINPDFKASDYGLQTAAVKAFNQGIQGNKVRSLNVVMEHFNTLEKAADALQSGDVRAINAVSQFIQTQTGKPAPANFNAVKEILADEIVAAVVPGVGALADRVALKKTILASASPEQLKGVVAQYKELIGGQLTGLETQYKAGTGRSDFKSRYLTSAAAQGLAPSSQYVETKVVNGRTLGKKADGTVEEIK